MKQGGSTEERRKEVRARYELIKQHLMMTPNKPVKYADLSGLFDVSKETIRVNCQVMAASDSTISFIKGAVLYVPPIEPVAENRYSDNKTEEGYIDPTAYAAMVNLEGKGKKEPDMQENIETIPHAGDVWDVRCSSGVIEKHVVIAVNEIDGYATCIKYCPEEEDMDRSCTKLYSKPLRYFMSRTWGTPLSQLTRYKNLIRDYLDIDPEEKIVEKVIEKKIEVPVEVPVPEVRVAEPVTSGKLYTQEELDMEIIKMRAEIYKECMYLMAGRKEM